MVLTKEEMHRIFEFMRWGVEKKGLKDKDFVSAYKKLSEFLSFETDSYNIAKLTVNQATGKTYNIPYSYPLSDHAMDFIKRKVDRNEPNPYQSLISRLNHIDKHNPNGIGKLTKENGEQCKKSYLNDYPTDEKDFPALDEIIDICIKMVNDRSAINIPPKSKENSADKPNSVNKETQNNTSSDSNTDSSKKVSDNKKENKHQSESIDDDMWV